MTMDKPDIPDFFINPKGGGNFDPDQFLSKYKFFIIGIIVIFLILPNIVILVGAGQRAVVFNRITGMEKRVLEEGIQIVIPFIEDASIYNVREISYVFSSQNEEGYLPAVNALTNDGQNILIEATVRIRPDFKELWWLHQNLGNDTRSNYVQKILIPLCRSLIREVISNYSVSQIYDQRAVVSEQIYAELEKGLAEYKIALNEFLFDRITFSADYQKAVEEKTKAKIELETKDNVIVEEQNKRDALITQAEGEAKAINLKVEALAANPSYIRYRKAQILGKRTKMIFNDKGF